MVIVEAGEAVCETSEDFVHVDGNYRLSTHGK